MCWRGLLTYTSRPGTSSTYSTGKEVASAQVRALIAAATSARVVALRVAACFDACKATFGFLLLAVFAAAPTGRRPPPALPDAAAVAQ